MNAAVPCLAWLAVIASAPAALILLSTFWPRRPAPPVRAELTDGEVAERLREIEARWDDAGLAILDAAEGEDS